MLTPAQVVFDYAPTPGIIGAETFTYKALAGQLESASAEVTLSVLPASTGGDGGPGAMPELDSLLLFGTGLSGIAGYAMNRLRIRRKRR